jgi:gliding motility-associated-like protein
VIKRLLFIVLFLIISSCKLSAQGTAGKDFWVAFMAQDWGCYYNNNYYNNDTAELFLSSQFAAKVTITAPGQNFSKSVTLAPNITTMVRMPREVVCRYSDSVTTNGVNIKADTTINVYAVNRYWWSKGATVVIPVTSIAYSPEYFITTNHDNNSWGWYCNGKSLQSPEFTIVGIADSSVIEVVPTGASSRNSPANLPFQITLKKGQTFQYMTTDNDLTGSIVRSKYINSKYAVFAGNRQSYTNRTYNNSTCYSSWDHIYEQMMPTITWGNNYTAMPFKNNVKGYTLKIVAAENNTTVQINGNFLCNLNQGKFYTHQVYGDSLLRITANNRISVAQFALGGYGCSNHPSKPYIGDPAMMMLFPDEQFGQSATVNTVSQKMWWWWSNNWWWQNTGSEHYINVMTKTADTANFQINNKKLPSASWKTKSNFSNYHFAQIQVDSGSHYLKSNKGFLAYVYGYLWYEGYAFAAAANFKAIQNNFVITNAQCKKDTVSFQAVQNDSFSNYSWKFGDNTTATGANVKHKYKDTGWYTVKMYCYQKRTNSKDSVTKSLYIADTKIQSLFGKDTAICGKVNFVLISKGFNIDNEYKWNDGHPVYYRAIKNPGLLWLEVKERNGCAFRDTFRASNSAFPKASFTVSNDSFCLNRNIDVVFKNRSTWVDTVTSYRWDFGDTVITTMDSVVVHRFKKANTFPIILRANTKFNCYHDTFMVVDVLPSPKANFTFTRKDTCFNNNAIELKNNTVINVNDHRRFKWYFSEGFVISNSNPVGKRTYTDSGVFKVLLIYENKNGCIDTMSKSLTVVPNPKANFLAPNAVYCSRDSIPFKSITYSKHRPLAYQWNWGDSTSNSTDSLSYHSFAKSGQYKVKLSVWSPRGCRDTILRTINVNETPVIDFTINKDTQCFNGHSFSFTNATKFKGSLKYNWNLSDASSSTDSNFINKTFSRDSIYSVKLSSTTSVGCYAQKIKSVYLGAYPDAKFTVNNARQCFKGNLFNLTNTSSIRYGSVAKNLWTFGNGDSSKLKDISNYQYKTEDSFTVRLITVSNLNCRDTANAMLVTFPQGKAQFANLNPVQCFDQHQFDFPNTSAVKSGSLTYRWTFGDNSSSDSLSPKKKYNSYGVYNVSLVSTSNQNCKDTFSRVVTVNASPIANFSINADKQCFKGNVLNYTNSSSIASGLISSNSWNHGDLSSANTLNSLNKSYATEDTFKVSLIVLSDKSCADSIEKQIVVYPQAKAKFIVNKDVQCFKQQNFVFTNQSTVKHGQLTYAWNFADGVFSTDTNPTKKYSKDSVYNVRLISNTENDCKDTTYKTLVLNVSPDARFAISNDRQCFRGNDFSFSNSSFVSKGSIIQYNWDLGDNKFFNTFNVNNYKYRTEDTFNVNLVVLSDKNCFDTARKIAVTFAQPVVKFLIPNDSQCWQKNFFVISNQTKLKYGALISSWNFGDNTFSNVYQPNNKIYPNKSASYTITYKAVSDRGCRDSAQHDIALLERPVSEFTINDSIQCFKGHLYSFANKTTFSAMSTLSYWWDYANGNKTTGITPVNATYSSASLYPMSLVSYSSLTNCYDTIEKIIVVAPHANVKFALNNDSQCFRFNRFVVQNNSTVQFGSMRYNWNFGDNSSDTAKNPIKSYSNSGSYTIKLMVETNYNCKDSTTLPVGFYATPKAGFVVNDLDQCFNKHSFDFTNTSTLSRGSFSSQWWFDDLSTGNSKDYIGKQFSLPENHFVELSIITDKGCKDTSRNLIYLENHHNSKIDFTELDSQCWKSNLFNFVNTKTNARVSFVNSKWEFGDGQTSNLDKPSSLKFRSEGLFKVMLLTQSAVSCLDTTYRTVRIYPHPKTAFTAAKVCFPEPVIFKNNTSISSGIVTSYDWSFGDNSKSSNSDPIHNYTNAGVYNVQLITSSGYNCKDTLLIPSAAVVQAKPKANFSFTQLPTIEQDQTRFQFKNLSSANSTRYDWDFGNASSSKQKDPIALYQDTGRFWITMVAYTSEACSDTVRKTTGMIIPDFFYYLPNAFTPNDDPLNANYKGVGSAFIYKFHLEIFNRWGEKMFETFDINQAWDGTYKGEICMEGAYLCRVQLVPFKGTMKVYQQMFMLMR